MNKNVRFIALCFLLSGLISCTFSEDKIDYENSVVTPALEIPPDLISRSQKNDSTKPGGN